MVMRTNLLRALSLLDLMGASLVPAPHAGEAVSREAEVAKPEVGKPESGSAVQGLRLTLDRAGRGVLEVTFQNVAETALVLNLGVMLGKGQTLIPDQLYLIVKSASGESRRLTWKGFRVTGRMHDFLVPLMPGAKYTLSLALNDFVEHGKNSAVVAGEKVRVVYLGAAASHGKPASEKDLLTWDGKADTQVLSYEG